MSAYRSVVDAALAEAVTEILLVRKDLRRALIVQPALLDQFSQTIVQKCDESLMAFGKSETAVMSAAAFVRDAQLEISRDHKAMADRVHASCIKAAQATAAEAVRLSAERELNRTSMLVGVGLGAGAALVAVMIGALAAPLLL